MAEGRTEGRKDADDKELKVTKMNNKETFDSATTGEKRREK